MHVVIAMDSFKNCMDSVTATDAVFQGIRKFSETIECDCIPLSDGGEGALDAIIRPQGGEWIETEVENPAGIPVKAQFGLLRNTNTAVVEMAQASGLQLLSEEQKNPMMTTTRGTGQLILEALSRDIDRLILTVGGSATNDCGAGMASVLGYSFRDSGGDEVYPSGGELGKISEIIVDREFQERIRKCEFFVACDVRNPLYGMNGASRVFAPQKGATPEMVEILDRNVQKFSDLIRDKLGVDLSEIPGSGAAGGLGGGSVAFLKAKMISGFDLVSDIAGLENRIQQADLVITGEGMIDSQTAMGKVPSGVAGLALKYGIPVVGICGKVGDGYEKILEHGMTSIFSITPGPVSHEESIRNAFRYTSDIAFRVIRLFTSRGSGNS